MAAFLFKISLGIAVALMAVADGASSEGVFIMRDGVGNRETHVFSSGTSVRQAMLARLKKRQQRIKTRVRGVHSSKGLSKVWRAHARKLSDELPFSKKWMAHHHRAPSKPQVAFLASRSALHVATKNHNKQSNSLAHRAHDAKDQQKMTELDLMSLVEKAHAAVHHTARVPEANEIDAVPSMEETQQEDRWMQKKKRLQQMLRHRRHSASLLAKNTEVKA
eukprot:TRINITY_DN4676_c0_g1_i2.p1 TRINITY_DN4676_c0_g1~~TRINITY_DN4676_c0_g1_i2.p1  ORF type:complete len:220 (-),score=50.27 TRINITY_DN4676_c0_g1_i2:49-708(-)